jgi:hypothetical protein
MVYRPTGRRVGRPEKEDAFRQVSVKLPPDLLHRVKQYASIHQQSLSELIRDGLAWRISEGDSGHFRNTQNAGVQQPESGNTVILKEVRRLIERLSAVVGVSEARTSQEGREEEDTGNTVLREHAQQEYGNTVMQGLSEGREEKVSARRAGRPARMREPILALLREHPEGLTVEEVRVFLKPAKPLGDTLQGLRRGNLVRTEGSGREMRYFLAERG